jgi:Cu/Ag efflux pump CusA
MELVMRGAEERLAPIMMTALTTGLALVPLILTGEIPGQEIEYPLGLVILFGLTTATLVNLVILPIICSFGFAGTIFRQASLPTER